MVKINVSKQNTDNWNVDKIQALALVIIIDVRVGRSERHLGRRRVALRVVSEHLGQWVSSGIDWGHRVTRHQGPGSLPIPSFVFVYSILIILTESQASGFIEQECNALRIDKTSFFFSL